MAIHCVSVVSMVGSDGIKTRLLKPNKYMKCKPSN